MPTYGYLHGTHVTVNMTEAVFDSVAPSVQHVMKVTVRNISMRGQRVRFVPPREAEFTMIFQNDIELAPGLEMEAELQYYSDSPVDIETELSILVGRSDLQGEHLVIPVRATLPGAKLAFSPIDFGTVVPGRKYYRNILVTNEGSTPGRMSVQQAPAGEKFTLKPLEVVVKPGESAKFAVELNATGDVALGDAALSLPVTIHGQMAFWDKPTEVELKALIADCTVDLVDAAGQPLSKSEFGRLYCGLTTSLSVYLVNNGPKPINYASAKAQEEGSAPTPSAEEEDTTPNPITIEPHMGSVPAHGRRQLTLHFAPPKRSAKAAKGFVAQGETEEIVEEIATSQVFEILETGQKIPLRIEGVALAPRIGLSQGAFAFGACAMYDHKEAELTLSNKQDLPYSFSFTTPAHFAASPLEGTIPPNSSLVVTLSFKPHQLGTLVGALQLLGFGGRVAAQALKLHGECTQPATRVPVGGTDLLPDDLMEPPNLVEQCSFLPGPVSAKWVRAPKWEMSESLQGGKVMQGGSVYLNPLTKLTKKKTYTKQMEQQPVLDTIDRMDTGLELPAAAMRAAHEHRAYYTNFLQSQREQREAKQKANHLKTQPMHADPESYYFSTELGLDPYSGCTPLVPPLPKHVEPLFLFEPYVDGEDARNAGQLAALFDQNRLITRKFKAKPEGSEEQSACKATLSSEELKMINGGPKNIDFGTVSVYTRVARNFTVFNELRNAALVAVDVGDEPEIKQPPPQVIPPGATAGFDLIFSSEGPQSYRRTITYTVNGQHAFRFSAQATVEPIEISLNTDELTFRFADGNLQPSVAATVTLTNPGTFPARFKWEQPYTGSDKRPAAFVPTQMTGEVPPKRSIGVEIIFTPYLGCQTEHMLTAIVEGGPSKHLSCKADIVEARAVMTAKKLDFGVIPAGVPKERNFNIKNLGQTEMVFSFDSAPAGFVIKPLIAAVRVGGSVEVSVETAAVPPAGQTSVELSGMLVCNLRCGKPIKLPLRAEARIPEVTVEKEPGVVQDEIDFGAVVVGAASWKDFTLSNASIVPATLHLDLSLYPEVEVKVKQDPEAEARAEAAAAADDRATTIVPEDESESPLQLISFPTASPPQTASGLDGEMNAGMQQEAMGSRSGRSSAVADEVKRIYSITIQPQTSLELKLGYTPRGAGSLEFELPLSCVGLPTMPALRKVVCGVALRARLKLSQVNTKFGDCILRDAKFPYTAEATLTNADDEELEWRLDEDAIPDDSGFTLAPSWGTLGPKESATVTFGFVALVAGPVDVPVPLYLDGGKTPYLTPHLSANAVPPRLVFDRPELVLPIVPLGHTSRASLYVINKGYDNLQVQHRTPLDSQRTPLSIEFPEGMLVGVSKERLLITVSFTAKRPTSFTAFIDLMDTDGNKFTLPVTATTENSVLTTQGYLDATSKLDPASCAIVTKEGKPPTLVPPLPPPAPPADDTSREARAKRTELAKELFLPVKRTDEAMAEATATVARGATLVLAFVASALMAVPPPLSGSYSGFPSMFTANKGQAGYDLINLISGKTVPMPDPPADRKNDKAALRFLVASYEGLLTFLRSHGAMLGFVKAERLLPPDDYFKLLSLSGTALGRKERNEVRREHAVLHAEAWLELLIQAVKTFVLARVTPRSFKVLPGMGDAAAEIAKEVGAPAYSSLLYSNSEILLMRWLEYHSAAVGETALGVGNPLARGPLYAFDTELKDGHVFARILLSHCPFLAVVDPKNPPMTSSGDPDFGTSVDNLFSRPCTPAQGAANLGIVLAALGQIGLKFACSAGMPPLEPSEMYNASSRELAFFALYLYQQLPHYVPKATIGFSGGLHEPLSRAIELSNPAKKPIVYEVRLEGNPCFKAADTQVRVDGRQTLGFGIDTLAYFTGSHTGRVLFLSRGDGVGSANASTLVFDLAASIDIGQPMEIHSTDSKLYQPQMMAVTVTNPFAVSATFKIHFYETKPPLDGLPKVATGKGGKAGGGGADEKVSSIKQGFGATLAISKAAKLAGLTTGAMAPPGSSADDPARKLPSTFWTPNTTISLGSRETATMQVQFLPFQLGDYTCTVLFADENVGEFSYELRGSSTLPAPIETLSFASEAASSALKEVQLPFRNPQIEKARALVLERSVREKERMSQLWGKEPLLKGPIAMQISYGSAMFTGPAELDLVDNERRSGRGGGMRSSAASTLGSLAGSGVGTPRRSSTQAEAPPTAQPSADANKLVLRFVPGEPGQYGAELLMLSPLDVRIYDIAGSCAAPGVKASLEFTTPARMPLRQELPIVNGSGSDWTISANLRGEGFNGPPSVKIGAGSTGHYPLDFAPEWLCEKDGELTLSNMATGDKYVYTLKGIGEEPLAEGNVVIECAARQPMKVTFDIFNVLGSGEPTMLSVESDLLHVSGPSSIKVPARRKGDSSGSAAEYTLTANPQLGGELRGSITFTASDGRYLWYTVEMHAEPPPCERKLAISAPLRKVVAVEIPISNPTSIELEFTVMISGDGLLGDETIRLPPGPDSEVKYELLFSPLIAGTTQGTIAFVNPQAGEFWYELTMTGEPTKPVVLPLMHCAVGASTSTEITISNPIGEELSLQLRIEGTDKRNFRLEGPKDPAHASAALMLAPYGELTCTVTYTPSALDEEQSAMISLTHPKLGEWLYSAKGMGHAAADMPPTKPTAPLGHTTSGSIAFRNPFDQPLTVDIALEQDFLALDDPIASPPFELLARRTSGLVIPPGTSTQFPFSYVARDMTEAHAAVVLHSDYKGRALTWRFPLIGEPISRPLHKPITLHVAARQPLVRELSLPLPGLSEAGEGEGFTYELDIDASSASLIESSLTISPMQDTLAGGALKIAIDWRPLRPVRTSAALIVRKASGGRWRFDMLFDAGEPAPDDVIYLEAPIHKTAQVQFKLCNAFDEDVPFSAYFSQDAGTIFAVSPTQGMLTRAGTGGSLFTVSYTPTEYGKQVKGTLIVLTDDMQWSYEVRGGHPQYEAPRPAGTKVDHMLDPAISLRLGKVPTTNFLKRNMNSTQAPPSP